MLQRELVSLPKLMDSIATLVMLFSALQHNQLRLLKVCILAKKKKISVPVTRALCSDMPQTNGTPNCSTPTLTYLPTKFARRWEDNATAENFHGWDQTVNLKLLLSTRRRRMVESLQFACTTFLFQPNILQMLTTTQSETNSLRKLSRRSFQQRCLRIVRL